MPEPLIAVGECEPAVICPLEIFKSTHLFPSLCFGTTNRDGSEKHYICCFPQHANPELPLPKTPLVFSLYGQIAIEDCFLTVRGCLRPMDEEPVASCWLEARPNIAADILWRGIIPSIEAIVDKYGGVVDPSHLVALGPDGNVRLQVVWQGNIGESGWRLPMFDEFGTQRVPASISEVPFGEAMHATFSLEFVHDRRAGTRTVFASLYGMFKA
ncbi:hypothetical protein GSI_04668 [Ganoderma sinense ZZ0214-1]|uniref:Uncharacterized protein n=1 Tax=Ganoderma sinense ZZ0214-1 TaxID=1077348 RepID=A0A2G8SI29_9APHY|nr:hypothetical protein GSI_04668 [Ganoderma sinense ZZ0214-1]